MSEYLASKDAFAERLKKAGGAAALDIRQTRQVVGSTRPDKLLTQP